MAEVDAIAADAEEAERGESVRVRVGVSQTAAAEIMPPALRAFREAHPAVEVILTELDDSADVAHLLRQGQLDLVAWTHRWRGQAELERAWSQRGIAPRIVYRTDDNLALQRLVAAGLGHACIGRLAARRAVDPALTWLPLRQTLIPREIVL